jgi:hypothetical protein
MLRRLEAEEALALAQIEFLPHLKDNDRKRIIQKWEQETKPRNPYLEYDRFGREVVTDIDDFTNWLKSFGIF